MSSNSPRISHRKWRKTTGADTDLQRSAEARISGGDFAALTYLRFMNMTIDKVGVHDTPRQGKPSPARSPSRLLAGNHRRRSTDDDLGLVAKPRRFRGRTRLGHTPSPRVFPLPASETRWNRSVTESRAVAFMPRLSFGRKGQRFCSSLPLSSLQQTVPVERPMGEPRIEHGFDKCFWDHDEQLPALSAASKTVNSTCTPDVSASPMGLWKKLVAANGIQLVWPEGGWPGLYRC